MSRRAKTEQTTEHTEHAEKSSHAKNAKDAKADSRKLPRWDDDVLKRNLWPRGCGGTLNVVPCCKDEWFSHALHQGRFAVQFFAGCAGKHFERRQLRHNFCRRKWCKKAAPVQFVGKKLGQAVMMSRVEMLCA